MGNKLLQQLSCAVVLLCSIACFCLAGSDIEGCTNELEYGVAYPLELDIASQRAALLSLYNSTGGQYWTWINPVSENHHALFSLLVEDVITAGEGLFDSTRFNFTSLFVNLSASDLAALHALSVNCELQQVLSFGQLLLRHDWGEEESYCQWHGITCCKTAGDRLSSYCTNPQSVASIYLPGVNLTGSLPDVFADFPDLQSLSLHNNPDLFGTIPNFGTEVANTFSELSISNTSIQQCDASHLAVYKPGLTDTVLKAGSSKVIGADNLTGCMPDFLLFCEQQDVANTFLQCPSIAVRRPVQIPTN